MLLLARAVPHRQGGRSDELELDAKAGAHLLAISHVNEPPPTRRNQVRHLLASRFLARQPVSIRRRILELLFDRFLLSLEWPVLVDVPQVAGRQIPRGPLPRARIAAISRRLQHRPVHVIEVLVLRFERISR